MRIIYMGTPDFAVSPLKALIEAGYDIVGVVTMPDKPAGRGLKISESAVKKFAAEKGLKILQPEKLKDEVFLDELRSLDADLGIVVAFRMLPEVVWAMPRMGTFNLHASLLPDYRGAAPINWAVINGDKITGVTTFMLNHQIDTGDIIAREEVEITSEDNAGTLHDKLMQIGSELVVKSVSEIENGSMNLLPQITNDKPRLAPKIFKETCLIDWTQNAEKIYNKIRGLSPYPAAWSNFGGKYGDDFSMKIFSTKTEIASHNKVLGTIVCDGQTYIKIACNDGFIIIEELQVSGKKRMDTISFLRGNKMFDPI